MQMTTMSNRSGPDVSPATSHSSQPWWMLEARDAHLPHAIRGDDYVMQQDVSMLTGLRIHGRPIGASITPVG
jgi:hypothetical protein